MSTPAPNIRVVRFGPFEADLQTGELRKHGLRVKVQDQPFQILAMLIDRPGELITREQIKERLWPSDTFVDFDHSVNTAIRRLRDALSDSADNPHYVETLPRRGYRFIAPVELAVSADHPSRGRVAVAAVAETTSTSHDARQGAPQPIRFPTDRIDGTAAPENDGRTGVQAGRKRRLFTAVAVALIAVIGVGLATLVFSAGFRLSEVLSRLGLRSDAVSRIDSIAIMPFANETGDSNFDYMADGLAESLIDNLAELPGFRVVSRNSTFQFRNSPLTISEIGRRVNARTVLTGSIKKARDGVLRMSVELVDTEGDRHLWGGEYAFAADQCWPIQPMLARELYDVLRLKLDHVAEKRIAQNETASPAAYDAYLRGRFAFRLRNRESLQQAISNFQHAIDLDPNYATAYAGLADALAVSSFYGVMPPRAALPMSDAAARHAMQLAPDRPVVRLTWAYELANGHHNVPAAIEEARHVVKAAPNFAEAHHALAAFLEMAGRADEAFEHRRIGMRLDPEWPLARTYYFFNLIQRRRYQDAREMVGARQAQATVAVYEQRYGDAIAQYDALKGPAAPGTVLPRAVAYAQGGRRSDAEAMLRQLLDERRNGYASASQIGGVYFALGDRDNAFKWFAIAADELDPAAAFLPHDPLLEPLHSDPRWAEFLQKMTTPR